VWMNTRSVPVMPWLRMVVLSLTCAIAGTAWAQKAEVSVDGSLLVFYPAKGLAGAVNLYGGGGSFVYNFSKHVGLKSEFQGYLSRTSEFKINANPPTVPTGGTFDSQMNMFTYLFGPQLSFPVPSTNVRVYGEALFGGAYTNAYTNFFKTANITSLSTSNNGFAMAFGGGVDLGITPHVAFRLAELDYLRTRYQWQTLGINNQNNVRFQSGVVFAWGE